MGGSERSDHRWQIAFGSGMVFFVLLFAAVIGHSVLEKLASLAVLVLVLLNRWLRRAQPDDQPAQTFLQKAFQTGPVMKVSAVILWAACVGLTARGATTFVARHSVEDYEGQVLLADGRPVPHATVMLQHRGKVLRQTVADAQGRFRFEGVKRTILDSESTRVVYRDRAATGSTTTGRGTSPVTLHLPLTNTPFRVSYFDIDGIAIDLLLAGGVDSLMAAMLGTQPHVLSTPTSRLLAALRRRFPGGELMFEVRGRARGQPFRVHEEDIDKYSDIERLAATVDDAWFDWSVSPQEFSAVFAPRSTWRLDLLSNPRDYVMQIPEPGGARTTIDHSNRAFRFWRYATAADVERLSEDTLGTGEPQAYEWLEFVRHVIGGGLPPDFLLYTIECICNADPHGCVDGEMVRALQGRRLRVRVAVLENVTSERVQIDSFVFRATEGPLRSEQADSTAVARQPVRRARWFPTSVLKPGESVLVPLALSFDAVQEDSVDMDPYSGSEELATPPDEPPAYRDWGQLLTSNPQYRFPVDGPDVSVTSSQLVEMARRSTRRPFRVQSYLYGSSVVLDSITADGTVYPVRKAERQQVSARGLLWSRGASCPHVYVWSDSAGGWVYQGAILVNRISRWKQGVQSRTLHGFTGRVRIAEEEPEVSYIDQIVLRVILANGTEQLLPALHPQLHARDGESLVLRRGQTVDLAFGPPPPHAMRFELQAAGYYVPLSGAELAQVRASGSR